MALIDQWLGRFDYSERHSIEIHADRGDVYRALTHIDLGDSWLIGLFFSLRGVPLPARDGGSRLPMTDFLGRFTSLVSQEPEELLVGAKLAFDPNLTVSELADAVDGVEAAIRAQVPYARPIYIEPDLLRNEEELRARG